MPRKPRKKSETGIYHVIVRGIGQRDIFYEEDDFRRYLDTTKKLSLESGVSVLGGDCLIPITALPNMDQDSRNKLLSRLRNDGLSLRQKCRITDFPIHIVREA